jgi:hypothetical protein
VHAGSASPADVLAVIDANVKAGRKVRVIQCVHHQQQFEGIAARVMAAAFC